MSSLTIDSCCIHVCLIHKINRNCFIWLYNGVNKYVIRFFFNFFAFNLIGFFFSRVGVLCFWAFVKHHFNTHFMCNAQCAMCIPCTIWNIIYSFCPNKLGFRFKSLSIERNKRLIKNTKWEINPTLMCVCFSGLHIRKNLEWKRNTRRMWSVNKLSQNKIADRTKIPAYLAGCMF